MLAKIPRTGSRTLTWKIISGIGTISLLVVFIVSLVNGYLTLNTNALLLFWFPFVTAALSIFYIVFHPGIYPDLKLFPSQVSYRSETTLLPIMLALAMLLIVSIPLTRIQTTSGKSIQITDTCSGIPGALEINPISVNNPGTCLSVGPELSSFLIGLLEILLLIANARKYSKIVRFANSMPVDEVAQ